MATNGWIGEQTVHSWGSYNSRLTTNVYINGIKRYSDHIDVSGVIYLFCKSSGAKTVWYDWAITAWCGGGSLGQIKPRTYNNNILGKSWSKNFSIRINCSNSATSATFQVGFSDSNMGGKDKYWTLYFDRYATSPSGISSTATYTQYSTISTSCSGINWGQGYSSRSLTCTASYTYNGKTENFTLGTWTDGATSKSVTKSDFNFPADLNVTIKWTASTNIGSTSSTSQVRAKQTFPAPNLSNTTFTAESIAPYCIRVNVSGVDFGDNYSAQKLELYGTYELDGIIYDNKLGEISNQTSWTLEYDASQETEPWTKIPDDSSILLRLVADNGNRTSDKTIIINCQSSYEAYVIEHISEEEKEKSEVYTGKNIQIQNATKDAPLADFKLKGETSQNGTPTPDAPQPVKVVTGENVVKVCGKNLADIPDFSVSGSGYAVGASNGAVSVDSTTTNMAISLCSGAGGGAWLPAYTSSSVIDHHITGNGGSYTISLANVAKTITGTQALYVSVYTNKRSVANTTLTSSSNFALSTITLDSDEHIKDIWIWVGGNTTYNASFNIQLEKGSSASSFEPYQEQSYEVNLGKNLCSSAWETGAYSSSTGEKTSGSTSTRTADYIPVERNSTYIASVDGSGLAMNIYSYDINKNFLGHQFASNGSSFTTGLNTRFITMARSANVDVTKIQLEKGSSITSYAAYFAPIELCKIGTYQDYIWKDNGTWKVHKAIGKSVLNGSEANWATQTSGGLKRYSVNRTDSKSFSSRTADASLSSHFTPSTTDAVGIFFVATQTYYFYPDQTITTLDSWKSWLASNNVALYYQLATPTDTAITNTALIEQLDNLLNTMKTYVGVNNIFTITPNEQGTLEIQYYTKWQNTSPAILSANGRNGTGNFKQVRRIGTK